MLLVCQKHMEMLENQRPEPVLEHRSEPDHNAIGVAIMADRELPSPTLLRQLLDYNPETGKLYWRMRSPEHFAEGTYSADRRCKSWNKANAGKEAFTHVMGIGYAQGSVNNRLLLAHRVIWAIQTGEWPQGDIDHINGDRSDNRWPNLRDVSHAINLRNAAGKSSNASGVTGVSFRPERGKWRARVMVDGRERCLGHFESFDDAVAARKRAMQSDGFTSRHGAL